MAEYVIKRDGNETEIKNVSRFSVEHLTRVAYEADELSAWLNTLGDMASGDTLLERVQAVVRHYATQVGRMA